MGKLKRMDLWLRPLIPALALLAVSCATAPPRWTPETVAPPASLDAAMEKVAPPIEGRSDEVKLPLPAEEAKVLDLSRDGAITTALSNNLSLEVAQYGPPIAATFVREARSAFDPMLTGTVSRGQDISQMGGITGVMLSSFSGSSSFPSLSSMANATPEEAAVGILSGLTALAATPKIEPFLKSDYADATATVANFLPTGTQVFLTGDANWSRTNYTEDEYKGTWSAGVTQALLRGAGPAVNLVALRQAKNQAARSQHVLRGNVLDTVSQVERQYWNLVLAQELIKIRQFGVQIAEEQYKVSEDLAEVGRIANGVLMSAKAEVATRRADLVDAQAQLRQQTLEMVRLLNPEVMTPENVAFKTVDPPEVVEVEVHPDQSAQLAEMYRPELAQARLDLANQDLEVVRTKNGLLPRLDAFAAYGRSSLGDSWSGAREFLDDDQFDNYRFGVQFEVPILNRAERARYTRAKLGREQAETAIANLQQMLDTQVHQTAIEVERQWQRIDATKEAVAASEEAMRVQQDRYSVGLSTNLDVLQVQRDLILAQVNEITARVSYIQALVGLYAAEGTLLERRGVTFDDISKDK